MKSSWVNILAVHRCFASKAMSTTNDTSQIPILLADIGEGIAEVEIMNWMVKVGDIIEEYDPLVQVQSDKATVEITSRYAGTIVQLHANVGDMVAVGTPLAYIEVRGHKGQAATMNETPTVSKTETQSSVNEPPKVDVEGAKVNSFGVSVDKQEEVELDEGDEVQTFDDSSSPSAKVLTTPAVRKLAMDHQVDLSKVQATGPQGRVLKLDVQRYLEERDQRQKPSSRQGEADTVPVSPLTTNQTTVDDDGFTTMPIRGYHRLMVQTMTRALQIPHMVYSDEINLNSLLELRQGLLREQKQRKFDDFPLPVLVFAIKALSLALKEFPMVNSTLNSSDNKDELPASIRLHTNHNIGVAMDTPRGLVVPVVRCCQDLSLRDIAVELERLKQAARASQLTELDLSGATITLSNIGAIGGTYMSPIITPHQVAILAMGRVQRLPRFIRDDNGESSDDKDHLQVQAVSVLPISWGGDHRVLDGATLARFSNRWKYYMESPTSMLLHLK